MAVASSWTCDGHSLTWSCAEMAAAPAGKPLGVSRLVTTPLLWPTFSSTASCDSVTEPTSHLEAPDISIYQA